MTSEDIEQAGAGLTKPLLTNEIALLSWLHTEYDQPIICVGYHFGSKIIFRKICEYLFYISKHQMFESE